MTAALTRATLAAWSTEGVCAAASHLDRVRSGFLDAVSSAESAPDRVDPSWSGQAADACRDRLVEESESARKLAVELEEVAEVLRTVGSRLDFARASAESIATEIESDPCGLVVHDDWTVNISPMALVPTPETDPERVRQAIRVGQDQLDSAVRFACQEDAACAERLTAAVERAVQCGRRLDHAAAFERATGRPPETVNDWLIATMLDPTSEAERYRGRDARVVLGRIEPRPGNGVVTMDLYIPSYSVFNAGFWHMDYDLGDFRGPESPREIGNARVELAVDFESGLVVARQNPSVSEDGDIGVGTPDVQVQQLTEGGVRIGVEAGNPLAPLSGWPVHRVAGDFAVIPEDGRISVGGIRGNYPAFEVYQHAPDGTVMTLTTDPAAHPLGFDQFGPVAALPFQHDVGESRLLSPFEDPSSVRFDGSDSRPGVAVLGEEADDVVVTPIAPRG
ncbi:WXG100 family type VII secretion target [Rhodococcus sp. IEGM 1408]|uniref:WXG100 family type VII secretion target n=1 Tax=Rhodococcus sp. IEGM 1408 TaxID=3082220 RepID=UPI00295573CD|nr:WXG100 family type VII secretion target [Rhodococcus sp. IEGM 1408]MDV8002779.1 WXG100 family type VII secretion target [Rhodococcus sp. IEGM 1408]